MTGRDLAFDLFAEFITAARRAEREAIEAEKETLVANGGLIGPTFPPRYRRLFPCPGCTEPCGQCSA